MKKIAAVVVSLIMILVSSAPVFASDAESAEMQKVLIGVKGRIGSTDEYDEFHSNVSSSNGYDTYNFSWASENKGLNLTVNSDGIITSYDCYDNSGDDYNYSERKLSVNKITSDEVMEKAKVLIQTLNPDIADKISITQSQPYESLWNERFYFRLQRTENGVDVVGDNGFVELDANADKFVSFRINYTQGLAFDDVASAIDADSAKEAYKEKLGLKLQYVCEDKTAVLEYIHDNRKSYISAIDGSVVTPITIESPLYKNESAFDSVTSAGAGSLSKAELENAGILENIMSKETTEKLLRENEILDIRNMELSDFRTSYNSEEKMYYHNFSFSSENESASAMIDAQNGDILRYSYYTNTDKYETPDNTDLAKSYIEKLAPAHYSADDSKAYKFKEANGGNYLFARYENGIECVSNYISISFNSESKISYYYINHDKVEFDSPEGILSESEACDKLFELSGYKMYYYPSCSSEGMKKADKAVLVYNFESSDLTLDAKKGTIKTYGNEEPEIGDYTDISGHYAENVIRTLAKFGIGFPENEFKPDELITQKDYVVLITASLLGNDGIVLSEATRDYSYYYERADIERIIIDDSEKNPDANVSREQAAVYMIRALGLDEVASLNGIYVSEFADVTSHIGHISILGAMGVINGYGGMFEPDKMLTRADAMIMLYNYLSK